MKTQSDIGRKVSEMSNLRKTIEDNYLTFVTVAAGSVAAIALIIWAITYFVKRVKNDS